MRASLVCSILILVASVPGYLSGTDGGFDLNGGDLGFCAEFFPKFLDF
jgi:hypothetical protein